MTTMVWQWDVDKTITWDDLQVGQRVNFAQPSTTGDEAYVVLAYEKDGKVVADIPNDMLQKAEEIRAYEMQNNPYQTILRMKIVVREREQPQDYITEPTRIQTWEDVLTAAEAAISAKEDAEDAADRAEISAERAGYMYTEIDENGHLIYYRTDNVGIDFALDNGRLIMEVN